jgi:hypothetical protein
VNSAHGPTLQSINVELRNTAQQRVGAIETCANQCAGNGSLCVADQCRPDQTDEIEAPSADIGNMLVHCLSIVQCDAEKLNYVVSKSDHNAGIQDGV